MEMVNLKLLRKWETSLKQTWQSFLLFKTTKMNGHFMGFHQLVQKLEQITPIISSFQDKQ